MKNGVISAVKVKDYTELDYYDDCDLWIAGQAIYGYHVGVAITEDEYEFRKAALDSLEKDIETVKGILRLIKDFDNYDLHVGCELTANLLQILTIKEEEFKKMSVEEIAQDPNVVAIIAKHALKMKKMATTCPGKIVIMPTTLGTNGIQM